MDDPEQQVQQVFDVIGNPFVALLVAVVVAMFTLGRASGMDRASITMTVESSFPAIAGILLIVSAGGGFKQVLVDTGVGTLLAGCRRAPTSWCSCSPGSSPCSSVSPPTPRRSPRATPRR